MGSTAIGRACFAFAILLRIDLPAPGNEIAERHRYRAGLLRELIRRVRRHDLLLEFCRLSDDLAVQGNGSREGLLRSEWTGGGEDEHERSGCS
jgi:hypothetical protein